MKDREIHTVMKKLEEEVSRLGVPIVTEISAADVFYPAEGYHQDYYKNNKNAPYCQFVISPKLDKLGLDD